MEEWPCDQCTFSNNSSSSRCEMCGTARDKKNFTTDICFIDLDDPSPETSPAEARNDSAHITCNVCSFDNDANATQCAVCGDTTAFVDAFVSTDSSLFQKEEVVSCRNCFVKFPSSSGSAINFTDQRKSNNCPNCGISSSKSSRVLSFQNGYGKSEKIYQTVTDGIIEQMTKALTEDGYFLPTGAVSKKLTIEYSLCSPCPHVSQRGNEGYEWSCGYRNIQMICHSLLNRSSDDYRSYESQMFNGKGDVPDIGGIQSWIEKAWKAGFDVPGGEEFGNILSGTEEWIGATECAALLRYFGIRAIVVDFSMNQEERKNRAAKLKKTLARRNKTIYNRKRKKNDEYYPPKKNVKSKNSVVYHNQSTTLDAVVDLNGGNDRQIDISDNDNDSDNNDDDNDFQNDDVATFLNGNGIKEHSLPIKDDLSHRNIPNKINSNSDNLRIEKKSVANDIENEKDSMSERVFNWVQKYHSMNMVITDAGSTLLGGNTSTRYLKNSVKVSRNNVINIDMEEEDGDGNNDSNDKYNNDNNNNDNDSDNNHNNHNEYDNHSNNNGNKIYNSNNNNNKSNNMNSIAFKSNTESSTPSSLIIIDNKIKQKQRTNVLPLFFQHQGHSRTIVGYEISSTRGAIIEKEKEKLNKSIFMNKSSNTNNSDSNNDNKNLEKIHSLLVFDPLSDGLAIKNSLQNKTSSWKSNVKRGRHTLTKNSYQIVYIAKGIMSDEEKERSKVIVGQSDFTELLTQI